MHNDDETIDAPAQRRRAAGDTPPALTATVLSHPDSARIGEQALLVGPTDLSRVEPLFCADGAPGAPLGFRGVSRTALRVTPVPGGWTLQPAGPLAWTLDGRACGAREIATDEELATGVVLGLGGWILLHLRSGRCRARERRRLGMVGVSAELEILRDRLVQLAQSPLPVLLWGETGTGKELAARALHDASERRDQSFVAVNLGAVTGDAGVSQLFGHERGSFTGADKRSEGLFGLAEGGTLLLDEIGETDDRIQAMLLRALEAREVQPLGGKPHRVDVRFVFATDADLEDMVARGRFRRALLYRVSQVRIDLPPLRARRPDLPLQLVAFVRQLAAEHGLADPTAREGWLPLELVGSLLRRRWSGNSRELKAVAGRLVLECAHQECAELELAPDPTSAPGATPRRAVPPPLVDEARVRAALAAADHRFAVAAQELGIARNTLFARMAEYGIKRPKDLSREEIEAARARTGGDLDAAARGLGISARALRLRLTELGLG